jgi:hypothetical protein
MKLIKRVGFGSLIAALSFMAGAVWGHSQGKFQAALEENKVAAVCLESSELSRSPEFTAYLKGRIYYNLASKFPNDEGYLLRRDWDFGPVDTAALKGRIYAKDPNYEAESFDAATRHLSAAQTRR